MAFILDSEGGAGKTFTLRGLREILVDEQPELARGLTYSATTGLSSFLLGSDTIHSTLGFVTGNESYRIA